MRLIRLLIVCCFLFGTFSAYADKCSVVEISKAIKKACAIVKGKTDPKQFASEVEKITFCGGNYSWIQTRNSKDSYKIVAHRVKPALKKAKKLLGKIVGGIDLFGLLNDTGIERTKDGDQKWIAYKWKNANDEQISKKLTVLHRCSDLWVAGAGIWAADCKDCPKVEYDKKYLK